MSNPRNTRTTREEEVAFRVLEKSLAVEIRLVDAGAGNSMPDGLWTTADQVGIVEVTAPPATGLIKQFVKQKSAGRPQSEAGIIEIHLNKLGGALTALLRESWAEKNVAKLVGIPANERHLYLYAWDYGHQEYFNRLTDDYQTRLAEQIDDIVLPAGITDVWFQGRAKRLDRSLDFEIKVARYHHESGWHKYAVVIVEQYLPPQRPSIADDPTKNGWRLSSPDRR